MFSRKMMAHSANTEIAGEMFAHVSFRVKQPTLNKIRNVECVFIIAPVLTRTVPSTTVSLPASSLTTLLTLTKSSDLNVVTTLDYSYQSSQTSWSYQIDLAS